MDISVVLDSISTSLPVVAKVWLFVTTFFCFVLVTRKLIQLLTYLNQNYVLYQLIPPSRTFHDPLMTSQLFTALGGLSKSRTVIERALGIKYAVSFEIASTKDSGIRFIVRVPENLSQSFSRLIHSYLSEVKIEEIEETKTKAKFSRVLRFKQSKHYAFPLKSLDRVSSHDPIAYVTSAMTNLNPSESISMQFVVEPVKVHEAKKLSRSILANEDLLAKLERQPVSSNNVFNIINTALFALLENFGQIYNPHADGDTYMRRRDLEYQKKIAKRITPARTLSYFEHELIESIHSKLSEPLFSVALRAQVHTKTKAELKSRIQNFKSAVEQFNVAGYQNLKIQSFTHRFNGWLHSFRFKTRMFSSRSNRLILSAKELASLYHFPDKQGGKTDNVIQRLSKTLPAPVSLKNSSKLDVLIGENNHHGVTTPIGLTEAERQRHLYIIGGTGNGKTTMMMYSIVQDIQNDKGVAVLDPHGDLAETLLGYIPEERIKDVIYLNPDDLSHPIGINLLELKPGLKDDDLLREKDLITESVISVLRKIFSEDDTGGHRIEYVLRNTIQTALTIEGSNLFTIFRLLNDTKYRKKIVKTLEDDDLRIFWKNELGKAGEMQKVKMAAGITSKIGRFLFSASAKRMLEQEKSTINFEDILDGEKILICNFSKGLVGEDTSTLFGTTILAKLQVAALRRARQKQTNRKPFYLYVDEFQNFATMSFVQMLSEARKYKLFLTMAEQSTQQQDQQRLVEIILANVGTVVAFRSGSPADERLILPLFKPWIEEGEIANLPAYSFYMRIAAIEAKEPFSGSTLLLDSVPDKKLGLKVVKNSQTKYGNAQELRGKPVNTQKNTRRVRAKPKQQNPVFEEIA